MLGLVRQAQTYDYPQLGHLLWLSCVKGYARDLQGDYVVIIDESIQIVKEKLLLMLGIKVAPGQCYSAPLCGADAEVLGIEVQNSWTVPSSRALSRITSGGTLG